MYSKISSKLTKWLIKLDVIESENFEVYEYGFELLVALVFSILTIITFSFISNRFVETLLYLIGFFSVRAICGGYHAKHHYSCFATTISTYFLFLFLYYCFFSKSYLILITSFITIVSIVLIIAFAPIEHPDNPMTEYRKTRSRLLCIILSIVLCMVLFVSLLFKSTLVNIFSYSTGTFFAALAILAAKIELIILKRKERQ